MVRHAESEMQRRRHLICGRFTHAPLGRGRIQGRLLGKRLARGVRFDEIMILPSIRHAQTLECIRPFISADPESDHRGRSAEIHKGRGTAKIATLCSRPIRIFERRAGRSRLLSARWGDLCAKRAKKFSDSQTSKPRPQGRGSLHSHNLVRNDQSARVGALDLMMSSRSIQNREHLDHAPRHADTGRS